MKALNVLSKYIFYLNSMFIYITEHLNNSAKRSYNKELQKKLENIETVLCDSIQTFLEMNKNKPINAYINNYLHSDIKREEVSLLVKNNDKYLLKFEYFTAIIEYESFKDVDYSKSKSRLNLNGFDSDDDDNYNIISKKVILN